MTGRYFISCSTLPGGMNYQHNKIHARIVYATNIKKFGTRGGWITSQLFMYEKPAEYKRTTIVNIQF